MLTRAARRPAAALARRLGRALPGGERGSVTVFTVVFAIAVIFLLGLIVDGGIAMNAKERAADIAGQAARAAADDVNIATLRTGGGVSINSQTACHPTAAGLVSTYTAGLGGNSGGVDHVLSVAMTDCHLGNAERTAVVTVQVSTSPLVPGVLGGFTEQAQASATVECGINQGGVCP
jgi:Flp pilus assembly protein TadG